MKPPIIRTVECEWDVSVERAPGAAPVISVFVPHPLRMTPDEAREFSDVISILAAQVAQEAREAPQ